MTARKSGASPDKRRKYDEAFRADALRLAVESRSTQAAAQQLGIAPTLLYRWQQDQTVAEVGRVEVARDLEVRALRAANKRLAQELDILKSLGQLPAVGAVSAGRPCEYLPTHRSAPQTSRCTSALSRAESSAQRVHAWQQRHQMPAWQLTVCTAFQRHGRRYGTRRLRAELQAEGHLVGRARIRRTLAAHGLRAQQPRPFVPLTTDSEPARCLTPNRLLGQSAPTAPNQVWVGDIT